MRKIAKNPWFLIIAFLLAINFTIPLYAGNSISGVARCRVPQIISMSEEGLTEETIEDSSNIKTIENSGSSEAEDKSTLIQKEEVVLEETKEVELINTVCAR